MADQAQVSLSPSSLSFVTTHCTTCKAGWTRKGANGEEIIVCLLDREPAWAQMIDCDRFEPAA